MRVLLAAPLVALMAPLLIAASASAQTEAFCTAAYDANGNRVGTATQSDVNTTLLLNQDGRIIRLDVGATQIAGNATVFYTGPGCTDNAYMLMTQLQPLAGKDPDLDDVWYPDTLALSTTVYLQSERTNSGPCVNDFQIRDVVPALNLTLPEFTPPFHLESEACYTPDPAVAALTPYGLGAMAFVLAFGAYLMRMRRWAE